MSQPISSKPHVNAAKYSIAKIAKIVGGEVIRLAHDAAITRISIDSRKIQQAESALFFALQGPRHDGHQFIRELYERGVRNFVVSNLRENVDLLFEANVIRVDDTLRALQLLAGHHRQQFDLHILGITGSNGKTIVKEWLYQLLQSEFRIVRSPRSYNSQVGVPLSVWNIEKSHTLGLFEAGISHPGEMEHLQKIIDPEIGVFINLNEAHDAQFANREEKAFEKIKLFIGCNKFIYSSDYPEIIAAIDRAGGLSKAQHIRCSFSNSEAEYYVSELKIAGENAIMQVHFGGEAHEISIPFNDRGSVENALICLATAREISGQPKAVIEALKSLQPVAMRLQMIEGVNGCGIINDAYNSDMASLEIALDFANQQRFLHKKTLILSDILQSGLPAKELYRRVAELCEHKGIDRLIGIGKKISHHRQFFTLPATFYPDTETFLQQASKEKFEHELILIKGARLFRFERISRMLEHQSHETVLEISLEALVHNLNYFKSKLAPQTRIMAMVKAFSYGMGSHEVAHLLEYNKVAYLAVAFTDEGVALRKAGVKLPIMVMNPEAASYDAMIRHGLEPEIYSFRTLKAFIVACKRNMRDHPQAIHLKLDTGMHRLGFEQKDLKELGEMLSDSREVRIASAFSHLAAADNAAHNVFTLEQIERFKAMTRTLRDQLGYSFLRHILNTAGILQFADNQFDMVRLGIGLYGHSENPEVEKALIPGSCLMTTISQIKHITPNDTVGYQRAGRFEHSGRIATLPIGYADGYSRSLGNGVGEVVINGYRARTVGNICMDMCMVDVTTIPCKEGDEVEVFGRDIRLNELAKK